MSWMRIAAITLGISCLFTTPAMATHSQSDLNIDGHWDSFTANMTKLEQVNNPDLRGFDPTVVTGPTDPFPDTSRPCCLDGSTEFGNGLAAGNHKVEINQNCDALDISTPPADFPTFTTNNCNAPLTGAVFQNDLLFQLSKNGLLARRQSNTSACDSLSASGSGSANDRSCNEITFGFLQDVQDQGQLMDLSFSIRSLTDADGNLIGAAEGTFTQSITEGSVTKACTGTFTFDEQNGFTVTSGPLHDCP